MKKIKIGYVQGLKTGMGDQVPVDLLYYEPERVENIIPFCPAHVNYGKNSFIFKSPYDFKIFHNHEKFPYDPIQFDFDKTSIKENIIWDIFHIYPESGWRNPNMPIVQMKINMAFLADEDIEIELKSPERSPKWTQMPGTYIDGSFNIYEWQRRISWGFEWHDTSKPIEVKRGDPLLEIKFNTPKNVQLEKIALTKEIEDAIKNCELAKEFAKGYSWSSLFKMNRLIRKRKFLS